VRLLPLLSLLTLVGLGFFTRPSLSEVHLGRGGPKRPSRAEEHLKKSQRLLFSQNVESIGDLEDDLFRTPLEELKMKGDADGVEVVPQPPCLLTQ